MQKPLLQLILRTSGCKWLLEAKRPSEAAVMSKVEQLETMVEEPEEPNNHLEVMPEFPVYHLNHGLGT